MQKINLEFLSNLFGLDLKEVGNLVTIEELSHLEYKNVSKEEFDKINSDVEKYIRENDFRVVGENDNKVWEKGWGEILSQVENGKFHPDILKPQYFKYKILRFNGGYIETDSSAFLYHYDRILRKIAFYKYLKSSKKIIELGCGVGNSQFILAEMFPNADLTASDWATASQKIISCISSYLNRPIKGVNFNMLTLEGWENFEIDNSTSILTVHALEQLGGSITLLMDKLIASKPKQCVHIEPIIELYDENNHYDKLAIEYHKKRNYLSGWLAALRQKEKDGKIKITEVRRLYFGDTYHEAYSVIVWSPL